MFLQRHSSAHLRQFCAVRYGTYGTIFPLALSSPYPLVPANLGIQSEFPSRMRASESERVRAPSESPSATASVGPPFERVSRDCAILYPHTRPCPDIRVYNLVRGGKRNVRRRPSHLLWLFGYLGGASMLVRKCQPNPTCTGSGYIRHHAVPVRGYSSYLSNTVLSM